MQLTKRKTGPELLRIVCMLMIICLHYIRAAGGSGSVAFGSWQYWFYSTLRGLCFIGVNCFVLITGYYQCDKTFSFTRIIKLLFEVWFFSDLIYIVLLLTKQISYSGIQDLLYAVFPVFTNSDGCTSIYVIVITFSPLFNIIIAKISKKVHLALIILGVGFFSVWPTVFLFSNGFTDFLATGYGVPWFIILYFTASYVKKYRTLPKNQLKRILSAT